MTSEKILNRIIEKGGLIGACANLWYNDKKKTRLFILECSAMCHTSTAKKLWGAELIADITRYSKRKNQFIENKLNGFDLTIASTVKNLRAKKGFKQNVIAQALGMSQGYYCKMELGIKPITIGQLHIIAKELQTSIPDILSISYKENKN